ncbi:MAG: DUF3488 and transglutaminase-like domain-containing protein [Salinibacterium sp.]|nr:DUF3488 and transglutaminase-like domain-containing protein [Salinibacterium sp.]
MAELTTVEKKPRAATADWTMSFLILFAIGAVAGGLGFILTDTAWWLVMMAMAIITLGAAALARRIARQPVWAPVASIAATIGALTLFFAPATSILGIIPTADTFEAFAELWAAGAESIALQSVPADAGTGIVFFLCLGVAAIAIAMDACVFLLRSPAITGLPLLQLLLVPSLVDPALNNLAVFAVGALAYVAILLRGSRRIRRVTAFSVAAVAVAGALVGAVLLPSVGPRADIEGGGSSLSTGINPIITLGNDLRRNAPSLALTYTTTSPDGLYLRLTALDDFTGQSWQPTEVEFSSGNSVDVIGPAPGLGPEVPVSTQTTSITVGSIQSRWLPAPYAPRSIEGLDGTWSWEADALSVRSSRGSSARNQDYTVESLQIAPSVEQLIAASNTVPAGLDRYLAVPEELPAVVAETAASVTAGAATHYEQAVALQAYFTSEQFEYSEDAPVEAGYDGSGASVLAAFLEAKSGYCVHYSSAMASMARTLGIPARVAVGFTPGEAGPAPEDGPIEYRVSTYNLHAWPELYFDGVGWVRFEPTPSRGVAPAFAPLTEDDPATPELDESVPAPAAASTSAPEPTDAPTLPDEQEPVDSGAVGAPAAASAPSWLYGLGALFALGLIAPAVVRAARRSARLRAVDSGDAVPGWRELHDTADDLGLRLDANATPRQLAIDLGAQLDDDGREALSRLRAAVEAQSFASVKVQPNTVVESVSDDVLRVLRGMRRRAGFAATARAVLLPRSLFSAWLPVRG